MNCPICGKDKYRQEVKAVVGSRLIASGESALRVIKECEKKYDGGFLASKAIVLYYLDICERCGYENQHSERVFEIVD